MRQVESAQLVWDVLAKSGPEGLSFQELEKKTYLTRNQILYAFRYIRDVFMDSYKQPDIYDHARNAYCLASEWCEAGDYIDFRVHGILSMVQHVEQVANASEKKWGDKNAITDVQRRVRHLREDLEALTVGNREHSVEIAAAAQSVPDAPPRLSAVPQTATGSS